MPKDSEASATRTQQVDLATTENGDVAHILVNGDPLCPKNVHAEYKKAEGLPTGGLCDNCKRVGEMVGLVEVPTLAE